MAETARPEMKADLKTMMKKLSAGASYRRMMAAHEAGHPICVASAGIPSEIMFAMWKGFCIFIRNRSVKIDIKSELQFLKERKLRMMARACQPDVSWKPSWCSQRGLQ